MNKKRKKIVLYYIAYLLIFLMLAFIYQITHRYDPPQSMVVSLQKACMNILVGQFVTVFGIIMIVFFTIWFAVAKSHHRRR